MTVEERLADMIARRTRGGTPPPCATSWANLVNTPPPDSAADESMALGRYAGLTFANSETGTEVAQP